MRHEPKRMTVQQMRAGQSGTVVGIAGGPGLAARLNSMGIRPGKRITKVSSMMLRGPVTVQVDRYQLAIGFGMASKIVVDAEGAKA